MRTRVLENIDGKKVANPNDALLIACGQGDYEEVRCAFVNGAEVNYQDIVGRTALLEAVHTKRQDLVRYLLIRGAKVNLQDDRGETPLMEACMYEDNIEVVKVLMENNADTSIEDCKGRDVYWVLVHHNTGSLFDTVFPEQSKELDSSDEEPNSGVDSPETYRELNSYLRQ